MKFYELFTFCIVSTKNVTLNRQENQKLR